MKLVIQRYTREASVRSLERNLAALPRAAAVKVAEQDCSVSLRKDFQPVTALVLETRFAERNVFFDSTCNTAKNITSQLTGRKKCVF